jgi:hypothetical protein
MDRGEWSRSRYWLCHFLQSRHQRLPVAWDRLAESPPIERKALIRLLLRLQRGGLLTGRKLVSATEPEAGIDPAYVQAVRLYAKEEQFDAGLSGKTLRGLGQGYPRPGPWWLGAAVRRVCPWAGVRFELSVRMIGLVLDSVLLELAGRIARGPALAAVRQQLLGDKQAHLTFVCERLTMGYADFNFLRRNLRRLRLRGMFVACAMFAAARHGPLLRAAGLTPPRFLWQAWTRFAETVEAVVPYRRDALLAALLDQREHPFKKTTTV